MKRFYGLFLAVFTAFALSACGSSDDGGSTQAHGEQTTTEKAKYVFLFIGDGMAMPQISSAEVFSTAKSTADIYATRLAFSQFPASGVMTTYDEGTFITDSASAATAMATGNKTISGVINMDPSRVTSYRPLTYDLKEAGYRIGIISSVSLDHATPAAFYASSASRGSYHDIGFQIAQSGFDYFSGGGFVGRSGANGDLYDVFRANGYTVATTKSEFEALQSGTKVVAINEVLQDSFSMPYELDRAAGDLSLADHTRKAIEMLENENGFFLMVEGGKVDWACHANDAAASISDTMALDDAVKVAIEFYEQYPDDTLIVVTGDHETGGMTLGFAGTQYDTFFDKVALQKGSFVKFETDVLRPYKDASDVSSVFSDLHDEIEDFFGLIVSNLHPDEQTQLEKAYDRSMGNGDPATSSELVYLLYGGYEPLTVKLTQLMNQHAGIGWTSYAHTGVPVPVFAIGAGSELFSGYYDNTDIYTKLNEVME